MILNHSLFLKSNEYIKGDGILARTAKMHDLHLLIISCQIPTGEIGSIAKGSALDFTTPRTIGSKLDDTLGICGTGCTGLDTCFIYDKNTADDSESDVVMVLSSAASGVK